MPVDFSIKDFFYPIALIKMRRFLEKSQWYSSDQLESYQINRLREILSLAYEHIPYYRQVFSDNGIHPDDITEIDQLKRLPVLTKDIVRREYRRLQSPFAEKLHAKAYCTSGSTGAPVSFLLDKPANILEFCYYWRHWSWAGYRLGARFGEFTCGFFIKHEHNKNDIAYFSRLTGRLQLNSLMLGEHTVLKIAERIRSYSIRFLNGLASTLYYFALLCKKARITDISFCAVFSQGEMLLPAYRSLIESTFHCKLYDSYGHMERTVAISECPDGGYHINSEYGILEVIRDESHSGENATGGIAVGTSLHNFSMPLIRYVINDRIELDASNSPCSCGRGLPLIKKLYGRNEDVIITPDGRFVTDIFTVFESFSGIELARIEQTDARRVLVSLACSNNWSNSTEYSLRRVLEKYLGAEMRVDIIYTDAQSLRGTCANKFKMVVSHLNVKSEGL